MIFQFSITISFYFLNKFKFKKKLWLKSISVILDWDKIKINNVHAQLMNVWGLFLHLICTQKILSHANRLIPVMYSKKCVYYVMLSHLWQFLISFRKADKNLFFATTKINKNSYLFTCKKILLLTSIKRFFLIIFFLIYFRIVISDLMKLTNHSLIISLNEHLIL